MQVSTSTVSPADFGVEAHALALCQALLNPRPCTLTPTPSTLNPTVLVLACGLLRY